MILLLVGLVVGFFIGVFFTALVTISGFKCFPDPGKN